MAPLPPPSAQILPPPPPIDRAPPVAMGEIVEETVTVGPDGQERRTVVRRPMNIAEAQDGGPGLRTRFETGQRLPLHWMDPCFEIRDHGRYALYQPMYGGRWVRYYDDALLVDPYGQVIDGQYGMRWDEYGADWRYDERGIPEYAYADDYAEDETYADEDGYGYQSPQAGPIVITETTVTTAPTVEEKVWYEDAPVREAPARGYKRKSRARN